MMRLTKLVISILIAGSMLAVPSLLSASHPDTSVEADGVTMHLGVVHSKVLMGHPESVPNDHPIKPGKNVYHILVSLYDHETGKNISDAKVKALISPMAAGGVSRKMERMDTAGFVTYCNFFKMKPQVTYSIDVSVQRPGSSETVKGQFIHHPFAD